MSIKGQKVHSVVEPGSELERVIESVSNGIKNAVSRDKIYRVIREPRYGERVYGYCSAMTKACTGVLKARDGRVYWHNGVYWEELSGVLLEQSVKAAFEKCGCVKNDYIRARGNLLRAARAGADMSPLRPGKDIVGFRNCVVDFRDIDEPVVHGFEDRMDVLGVLPYDWEPGATCEGWVSFLKSVLEDYQIDILQKFLGLGCVPRNNMKRKVEKTLWLVGSGANGKSVIHDVVQYVFGADAISNVSLHNLIKSGDEGARFVAAVDGKTFNYCTEVDAVDIGRYEGNFKSLVSGERQQARRIGGNVQMIEDIPYLIFNMNQAPSNKSMGQAFMRRLEVIDFRTTVSVRDMRTDLADVLTREASGIRNWMIEGYKRLRDADFKFITPKENREYMMQNEQSTMVFMDEMGYMNNRRAGHPEDENNAQWVSSKDLYDEYAMWCRNREGIEPDTSNMFGRKLQHMMYVKKRTSIGVIYKIYSENAINYALPVGESR